MARFSVGRAPMLGLAPGLFSVISLLLVTLVLFAGVNNHLTSIYYLKTDASKLSLPSKLSNSTFLKALTSVSSTDYVGPDTTASSLGIADSYTIHLLTACGHFPDGSVSCSKPSIGFAFNPGSTMRLDGTPLQGTYSDDLLTTLSRYSKLSGFLAGAYIASGLFLLLTLIANCVSVTVGAFTSGIATVVLFGASVASAVVFGNLNKAFNGNFQSSANLSSDFGRRPIAISFLAFLLALVAAISLAVSARHASNGARRGPIARSVGSKGGNSLLGGDGVAGADPYAAPGTGKASGKKGFLASVVPMLPGQKHKYVQVEDQPALVRTDVEGRQRGLDEDWGAHDEYSRPGGGGNNASPSLPLVSMGGNKQTRDLDSGYEPYSSQTGPGH